jgi:hypothetical protein
MVGEVLRHTLTGTGIIKSRPHYNILTLQPVECRIKGVALNLKSQDVIMLS